MPAPDPFDELDELFAEDELAAEAAPHRTPTRKEAQVPFGFQRTPTRAEALPGRTPTRMERSADESVAFHPTRRPPLALLCVLDDGADDGEWNRIRQDRFVIGRSEGDLKIGHDALMAPRHAEIVRHLENGKWQWHLTDLRSETGTFVAVAERPLKSGSEMWLGRHRYRFEQSSTSQLPTIADIEQPQKRYVLDPPSVVFGRQPATGGIARPDDPCLNRDQVRFELTGEHWKVTNLNSKNGLWVRVDRVRFPVSCRFQLGEQRFLVRVIA